MSNMRNYQFKFRLTISVNNFSKYEKRKIEPLHQKTKSAYYAKTNSAVTNCTADQRLCFHFMDRTIPLLPTTKISSL